ncbi:MAG: AAA family ATPase [Nanoarchaeota archaeon]
MVQLIKLELEGFGKFDKEKTINFEEGINFITGLNEAGKSTILEAVTASIFKYTRAQIEPFLCWKNDDVCRTALTYKTDKSEIFRILSDYKSGKRKLEKIEGEKVKEIATVDKNIDPYLKVHFGFDDKKVFENTTFIRQSQMAILEDNSIRNKIRDMIEEVFAGRSEASATKALAKIRKISKDSSKEIENLDEERIELKEKLDTAEETKERLNSDSDTHKKVNKDLTEKSEKLVKLKEDYKRFQEKEESLSKVTALSDKIKKIDKILLGINENDKKRDRIIEKREKYSGYESISESNFSEIKDIIKKIDGCENTLHTLGKAGIKKTITEEKLDLLYVFLFILGISLVVIYGLTLAIIGIPLAIYAYRRIKIKEEKEIVDAGMEKEVQELTADLSEFNNGLTNKTKKIKDFDKDNFIDQFTKYSKLLDEENSLSESISELIKAELEHNEIRKDEEENLRKITSKKTDLINDFTVEQNNLKKYKLIDFKQEDFDDLEKLDKEVEKLKETNTELKTSIKTTNSLVESPEEIQEKLDAVEDNKLNFLRKIEEHDLAAKFLELAESEVHHKFTPAIERNSIPILKEITNGKYSDLKIEEDTLNIMIKAPEIKEYVDVFYLSQGARDQLYFTLRTVMSDLLSGNAAIPLILDDPFHNFDDTRLSKTITTLKQIAKNKQIILISHRPYHQEYKNFSNNIITL